MIEAKSSAPFSFRRDDASQLRLSPSCFARLHVVLCFPPAASLRPPHLVGGGASDRHIALSRAAAAAVRAAASPQSERAIRRILDWTFSPRLGGAFLPSPLISDRPIPPFISFPFRPPHILQNGTATGRLQLVEHRCRQLDVSALRRCTIGVEAAAQVLLLLIPRPTHLALRPRNVALARAGTCESQLD